MDSSLTARQTGRPLLTTAARQRRFMIFVIAIPIVLVMAGVVAMNAISRLAGNEVTDGAVEVNGLSFLASFGGVFFVMVALMNAVMQRFPTERSRYEPWPLTAASTMFTFGCVAAVFSPSTDAPLVLGVAVPLALAAGAIGYLVARSMLPVVELPVTHAPAPSGVLRHGSAPDMTPIWSGRAPAHGRRVYLWIPAYVLIGLGCIAISAISGGSARAVTTVSGMVATIFIPQIAILLFKFKSAQVRISVGPGGLLLRSGLTRRVAFTVDLEHIDSAWHTTAPRPNFLTSYGKQSSEHRLAYLTREGPALMVKLTDGTDVVVSLDNPDEAAGVLNQLLDRRASRPPMPDAPAGVRADG